MSAPPEQREQQPGAPDGGALTPLSERLRGLSPAKRAFLEQQLRLARERRPPDGICRRAPDEPVPLSAAQELLWRLERAAPGTSAYNVPRAIRIRGVIDVGRLQGALDAVVARHEILRTVFLERDGEPYQVVRPARAVPLTAADVRGVAPERREEEVGRLLREAASEPFDLAHDLLLRATLIRVDEDDHVLLLLSHHIASDGASRDVFFRDLGALYDGGGAAESLPPLAVQYRDFAAWQREQLTPARTEVLLSYWRERLAGVPSRLELPLDRPRPAVPSFEGARRVVTLPRALADAVTRAAGAHGTTPFVVLLAAFQSLLHRYTSQDDVVVGTVLTGRDRPELDGVVGYFSNTLPVRAGFEGDPSFGELLGRVREGSLGAAEHADIPFERLALELRAASGQETLFDVLFTMLGGEAALPKLGSASLTDVPLDRGIAKFDLTMAAGFDADGLRLVLEYRTALFDATTADRMLGHFATLLAGAVAEPETPVSRLPLLTAPERHLVVREWNDTAVAYPAGATLVSLLEEQARRTPDAAAVVSGGVTLTYAELDRRGAALARYLRARGVGADRLVGVCMERSPELMVALVGILKAGGGYVPLDPEYPSERLAFMLSDSGVSMLLTQERFVRALPPHNATTVSLDTEWRAVEGDEAAASVGRWEGPAPADVAYMIYTSGSTGRPKGALNAHVGIVNRLLWMQGAYALTGRDVVLQKTPVSFDVSVWELFWPLITGATLVMADPGGHRDPAYLADVIERHGVTVLHFVPSMLRAFLDFLDLSPPPLPPGRFALRDVMCSGEALTYELQERFFTRLPGARLHNLYGPTEAAVDVTYWQCVPADPRRTVPIGRPVSNTQCYVLDRHRQPVPVGVAGELYLGGVQVGSGYHNRPDLTAERFVADPFSPVAGGRLYKTGDLARWRADDGGPGVLEYLGRIDTQVKLRGFRIELGEIEGALLSHPKVRQGAVVAVEMPGAAPGRGELELVAYYTLRPDAHDDAPPQETRDEWRERTHALLRAHLSRELPDYMIPAFFVELDAIPLMPNGKLDRKALPAPDTSSAPRSRFVAPRTATEEHVAAIWRDVLRREHVGVHDRFFDIGGHSLLAMRVIGRLQAEYGVQVSFKTFFAAPTVEAVARVIEDARTTGGAGAAADAMAPGEMVPRRPDGSTTLPLSFEQHTLWLREQMAPHQAAYNVPMAFRVRGPLDVAAVRRALDAVVARHEAFRTTFAEVDGEPVQVIGPPQPVTLAVTDLRAEHDHASDADREARAHDILRGDSCAPFDLTRAPLLRARVVHLDDADHYLLIVAHHIVFDGGSTGVLLRELNEVYRTGSDAPPGAPPLQQGDYAVWQRGYVDGDRLRRLLDYWTSQLDGAPSRTELPTDRPRLPDAVDGARLSATFPPRLLESLRGVARERDATLFMALLAAFATLLHRYRGQNDVVIGSPVAGRHRAGTDGIVGLLAKALPLRTRFEDDPTFHALLDRVRDTCVGAYEHQDVPYDELVLRVRAGRPLDDAALFSVLFVLQDGDAAPGRLGDATLSPVEGELDAAKFDLALSMRETADGLHASLQYRTSLFERSTVGRMLHHLEVLLGSAAAAPDVPVSTLPMLTAAEVQALTVEWNRTDRLEFMDEPVHTQFAAQAAATPAAVAVALDTGERLTYAELDHRANQLAHVLRRLGVGANVPVALFLERSHHLVVALLGVLKAGGANVPLDPEYPAERLAFMLDDAAPRVIVTTERLRGALPLHELTRTLPVISLDGDAAKLAALPEGPVREVVGLDDVAYILYTSGSTGRPKGVLVSHRAIGHFVRVMRELCPLTAADTVFQKTPITFDPSALECYLALTTGARLLVARPGGHQDLAYVLETMRRERVTVVVFVPSVLAASVGLPEFAGACESLKVVICGGEALSAVLARRVQDAAPDAVIYNMYGPTEATVAATLWRFRGDEDPEAGLPIGRPIANTRAYVLDPYLQPVPVGVAGELCLGGVQIARGYLNRPELTAEKFLTDPFTSTPGARMYRTGDSVRWRSDGVLEFLGRLDEQVKLHGIRVELGEVERAVAGIPGVGAAAAALVPHPSGGMRLAAYWVSRSDSRVTASDIRTALRAVLPGAMIPSAFVEVDRFPLTSNGKVDRRSLPAPNWGDDHDPAYVAPDGAMETVIAGIWGDVLKRGRIGVETNFFDLGGHSLFATQIVARVAKLLRVRASVRSFFEHPTVRAFARELVAHEAAPGQVEAVASAVLRLSEMTPEERRRRRAAARGADAAGTEVDAAAGVPAGITADTAGAETIPTTGRQEFQGIA